jgi:hypothetical protein
LQSNTDGNTGPRSADVRVARYGTCRQDMIEIDAGEDGLTVKLYSAPKGPKTLTLFPDQDTKIVYELRTMSRLWVVSDIGTDGDEACLVFEVLAAPKMWKRAYDPEKSRAKRAEVSSWRESWGEMADRKTGRRVELHFLDVMEMDGILVRLDEVDTGFRVKPHGMRSSDKFCVFAE